MLRSWVAGLILAAVLTTAPWTAGAEQKNLSDDEMSSGYFTVTDETGKVILETGRWVRAGDEFINEKNQLYEIVSTADNSAKARAVPQEKHVSGEFLSIAAKSWLFDNKPAAAIYHTHTDESYIPTDGQSGRDGNGSIMRVGEALADALRARNYEVAHSTALHDPHDANAYQRSRRTAVKLMRKNYPAIMIDVHRDSVPLKNYHAVINGKPTAKILLVVGKENQNRRTIQNFAGQIKAAADNMHPGLIRGIFIARGGYNQDLMPRSILFEMGTQYNSLEAAQRSAYLIADAIPAALSLTNESGNEFNSAFLTPDSEGMTEEISDDMTPAGKTSGGRAKNFAVIIILAAIIIGLLLYFKYGRFWEGFFKQRD